MLKEHLWHLIKAIHCSWQGLIAAWKNEKAFQQEVVLSVILIPFACWLGRSLTAKLLLISVWLLVLIVELINSAIEATIDRISTEIHPLSGRAKDLASAAVLLAVFNAGIVWSIILVARIFNL